MQAVLLAFGPQSGGAIAWTHTPSALKPVLDRPLVHHVIERLVDRGVSDVVVVTLRNQDAIGAELGDGRRWGCSVTHIAVASEADAIAAVRQAALASADPLIALAAADRLPLLTDDVLAAGEVVVVESPEDGETPAWSGWAVLPPARLAEAASAASLRSLGDVMVALGERRGVSVSAERWLDARSAAALLASNRRALESNQQGLLASGRELEPGIWVGRNVRLGQGARLVAPVFIGDDTSIGAGSTVGPFVAVGSACLVDADAMLERSMVTAGTYVGEGLTVVDAIADGPILVNVRLGVSVRVDDGLLLAATGEPRPTLTATSR